MADSRFSTKNLLAIAALGEAATGLIILAYPPVVIRLLFGTEITASGIIVSRLAGIALIGLGLACLPSSDADGDNGRALLGMFSYNFMVTLYLGYVALIVGSVGTLMWPTIVLHVVLTILLALTWFRNN